MDGQRLSRRVFTALIAAQSAVFVLGANRGSVAGAADDDLLSALIKKANQGPKLLATIQSTWRSLIPAMSEGFRKRFPLNIEVEVQAMTSATDFPLEIAALKSGVSPNYDVVVGDTAPFIQLFGAGGLQPIEHWRDLLSAINPLVKSRKVSAKQISPDPFAGYAFLFMANVKEILYNPNLIKPSELPKTHPELASQKYRGEFTQPPWTSHWEISPALLTGRAGDRDKWLDVVRSVGRNNSVILSEAEGAQRVLLGQYPFSLSQDVYLRTALTKDPKAPLAGTFFRDYNELNSVFNGVMKGARNPAAATLFTLWMTTPEAEAIWQPAMLAFQPYGSSRLDVEERESIKSSGAKVLGFFDDEKTLGLLKWEQTPEGTRYLEQMMKAIQGE